MTGCGRLDVIFSLISRCDLFADIGCDHGYIAQYAASKCKKVIAADISEKCLIKAKKLLEGQQNVIFLCGDGLSVLDGYSPNQIAICGMGGYTIIDILRGYSGDADLILQPQNDIPAVRSFLQQFGYCITYDVSVREDGKFYTVLAARRGSTQLSDKQVEFGVFYLSGNSEEYLTWRLHKLQGYPGAQNKQKAMLIQDALSDIKQAKNH